MNIIERAEIASAAHDRFNGRPFAWGGHDCIQLAKFVIMRSGRRNPLRGLREYRGEVGAIRALREATKAAGLPDTADLGDMLDAQGFVRMAPSMALPGDLIGLQGDAPFGFALSIAMGNGKALGFALNPESGDHRCFVGEALLTINGVTPAVAAWSLT